MNEAYSQASLIHFISVVEKIDPHMGVPGLGLVDWLEHYFETVPVIVINLNCVPWSEACLYLDL